MKVIISGKSYPEKRNITVNNNHSYRNFRYLNSWTWLNAARQKFYKKNKKFIFSPPDVLIPKKGAVIHLFNEVAATQRPWFSTFETELPRVLPEAGVPKLANKELHRQLQHVAAPACKAIIAISEATREIQLKLLAAFPNEKKRIQPKLHVLHPPQRVLHDQVRKVQGERVVFTFVGNEFYRKGGAEVVLAFQELKEEGALPENRVQVNLVGNLTHQKNIALKDHQDDAAFYQRIESVIKADGMFRHSTSLPNEEVIALFKQTHVGLLPTWQDTYGFSLLEMQACGCPVITTNVRALPEINPQTAGWTIACPLNAMFELDVKTAADKAALRRTIIDGLKQHILSVLQDTDSIRARSAQSLERIKREHDPVQFARKLDAIYALADGKINAADATLA